MKQILILSFVLISFTSFGQDITGCDSIKVRTNEQCKSAESCIKQLSAYVLSKPMIGSGEKAHYARKVILAWMGKTPDYTFGLNTNIMKIIDGDNLLLFGAYTSSLANSALTKGRNSEKYAIELFVKYIQDSTHKVAQTKDVKKLINAWNNGEIDKYIE